MKKEKVKGNNPTHKSAQQRASGKKRATIKNTPKK